MTLAAVVAAEVVAAVAAVVQVNKMNSSKRPNKRIKKYYNLTLKCWGISKVLYNLNTNKNLMN